MPELIIGVPTPEVVGVQSDIEEFFEAGDDAPRLSTFGAAGVASTTFGDATSWTQILAELKTPLAALVPLLAYWLGRGKAFELKRGTTTLKCKGYGIRDLARLMQFLNEETKELEKGRPRAQAKRLSR